MIINDKEYGEFDVDLEDDGTLDTVISVWHKSHGRQEIRYSTEYGAMFRSDDGAMYDEEFSELAQESVESYIEQYLI